MTSRMFAALVLLLGLFFLVSLGAYHAYLAQAEPPDSETQPGLHPALAQRAVVFIIDAFHPAHAFDPAVMPTVAHLAGEGASGIVRTGPVSVTAPCVFELMTGRPGSLVQAVFNFHSSAARGASLPRAVVRAGRKVALAGDKSWTQQFGWLADPADRHAAEEMGVTLDPRLRASDREVAEFMLGKMADPAFGLLVAHVNSADAAGHVVTPYGEAYIDALRFLDGLVEQVAREAAAQGMVLLVTGDHGMGARGSHGGAEEEARRTPYVLRGPGVKKGVVRDISQSAVSATLAALLGLPLPGVSQYPPVTELLDIPPEAARQLTAEYFAGKLGAAQMASPGFDLGVEPGLADVAANERLNAALFGGNNPRQGARALTVLVTALGVLVALLVCKRSAPMVCPPLRFCVTTALLPLVMFAAVASILLPRWAGENIPFGPLARGLDSASLAALGAGAWLLLRSARLRRVLGGLQPVFFVAAVVLSTPLLGSAWHTPAMYFEALLLTVAAVLAFMYRTRVAKWLPALAIFPLGIAGFTHLPVPAGVFPQWSYLLPLSAVIAGLAFWNLRSLSGWRWTLGVASVCIAFAAAWLWRMHPVPQIAEIVLVTSLFTIAAAALVREPTAAATLVVAGSAALFLMMADFGREALVFLVAASGALVAARVRLDFSQPRLLYAAVGLAILLRLCLFFQLGDEYMISSIRTASGFRLVDIGLPLGTVVALVSLKYTLVWFVILAAGLPSLIRSGREAARHAIHLIALAYVARLALVGAAADPLRSVTDGVKGLVGVFCVSWAEFVTFAIAATVAMILVERATRDTAGFQEKQIVTA